MSVRRLIERGSGGAAVTSRPDWRRRSGWPTAVDVVRAVLAAVLGVGLMLAAEDQLNITREIDWAAIALTVAACAPIAFRRTDPLAAPVVALTVTLVGTVLGEPMAAGTCAALGLVGLAASRAEVPVTGTLGIYSGLVVAVDVLISADAALPVVTVGGFAVGMLPALIGEKFRAERIRARDAHELAQRIEQLRDREIGRALAEERVRIARDVHDITGHHLSAISLQASGAGGTTSDPEARAAFDRIHGLTTEALGQTRRALGVLRQQSEAAALAPSPRLAQVEDLLLPARAAGIAVELRVEGDARELSETVEMCAYRVIQESLTNVARHAGARSVRVAVAYGEASLGLTVGDDGIGGGTPRPGGGIAGMRERVALVGGELTAGPDDGGGWAVRARLPLDGRG
ncbi:sensor histidine kinase [Conexibacter sp. CPCC 206217]|uniref:sensor histidine kinase n=1 Tax=Conexibacter sp. CPCC 206217 TaxID=3064574 RepID=UPI00271E57E4|nr:histidine kinase [Conexibacter sp. CPCC 206217]MDO8211040.1 histidine kinase [Conexibacter sp. CPCC 206217]